VYVIRSTIDRAGMTILRCNQTAVRYRSGFNTRFQYNSVAPIIYAGYIEPHIGQADFDSLA
jgi:hypothetical protein